MMAEPNSASDAIVKLESSLKDVLVKICETEQRSKLLSTLLRLELLTKDVKNFILKQFSQQRNQVPRGLANKIFKSGKHRMLKKLLDSRKDETKHRKERDKLRSELENLVSKNVFLRIWKKLKSKVMRIRMDIKKKNSNKIKGYIEERDQ